jgi:hypothetical protein
MSVLPYSAAQTARILPLLRFGLVDNVLPRLRARIRCRSFVFAYLRRCARYCVATTIAYANHAFLR